MDPQSPKNCPSCGTLLDQEPDSLADGLCPRCLLERSLQSTIAGQPVSSGPPAVDEVAAAFPELEVIELIGRGGMGAVYKARQKSLDRLVALKLLPLSLAADPEFTKRFEAEAKALAALNHPNIVTVHEFGQRGDFYFLLMEYVDGPNLRGLIRDHQLAPEEALTIVPPLCEALEFAHKRNIVHCDIKPENLLLNTDGQVKIADFGIARILGQSAADPESENSAGTPAYMAPEQIESPQAIDTRADIYSLGVVFYEMLTGERPNHDLTPPSGKNPSLDVRLDEVVLRALEANPNFRWQSANELNSELQTILTEQLGESKVTPPENLPHSTPKLAWIACTFAVIAVLALAVQFFAHKQVTPVSESEHQAAIDNYFDYKLHLADLGIRFSALDRKPQRTPAEEIERRELWEQVSEGFRMLDLYGELRGVNDPPRVTTGSALITILCVILFLVAAFLGLRHLSWLRGQQEPLPALAPGMIGTLLCPLLLFSGIILTAMRKLNTARLPTLDEVAVGTNALGIVLVILACLWTVRRLLAWTRNHRKARSFRVGEFLAVAFIALAVAVPFTAAKQTYWSTNRELGREASQSSESHQLFISRMHHDTKTPQDEKLEEALRQVEDYARKAQKLSLSNARPIKLRMPGGALLIQTLVASFLSLAAAFFILFKMRRRRA